MIYDNIRALCEENGMTIYALEKELGFGNGTISSWKTSSPTIEKIDAVAKRFHVKVDELISRKSPALG